MSEFDKKISALTSGTDSTATDEYVIARGGSNFKISGALVAAGATKVGTLASLAVTGNVSLGADVVLSRGAADRLDLASGDSLNIVSGTVKIAGTDVLGATTLGSGVTASSLTSVGTLASLAVTGDLTVDTSTLKVDAANNAVGVGTSNPNAFGTFAVVGAGIGVHINASSGAGGINFYEGSGSGRFSLRTLNGTAGLSFYDTSASTERMRIDASGNVGIGGTPVDKFDVFGANAATGARVVTTTAHAAYVETNSNNGTVRTRLQSNAADAFVGTITNHPLVFQTNNTERARITAGGYFKASNAGTYFSSTGSYHELRGSAADDAVKIASTHASTPYGLGIDFSAAAPNNTTQYFLLCNDTGNTRAYIYSDGTFGSRTNTYGAIVSERRFKQDIQDINSQWDDIKNIRLRKFRFIKDVEANPDTPLQLGVIIDELEQVSPGLVYETPVYEEREVVTEVIKTRPVLDEDGEPMLDEDGKPLTEEYTDTETTRERGEQIDTHKGWKTSVALLKAMGALQEAMARIESLEARLDALEN
jgi:hypothetical protein